MVTMPDLSTELKQRAVDLAVWWDCTEDEALERLRDMLIGETPPLKEFFGYFDEVADA